MPYPSLLKIAKPYSIKGGAFADEETTEVVTTNNCQQFFVRSDAFRRLPDNA